MDFLTTVWDAVVWTWQFMIDPEHRWLKIAFVAGMVMSAVSKKFSDANARFAMALLKAAFYILIVATCIIVILALT